MPSHSCRTDAGPVVINQEAPDAVVGYVDAMPDVVLSIVQVSQNDVSQLRITVNNVLLIFQAYPKSAAYLRYYEHDSRH